MSFHIDIMLQTLLVASRYIWITLWMSGSSLVIGSLLGLGIALIRYLKIPLFSQLFQWTMPIFKGIPIVLLILGVYLIASKTFDNVAQSMHWSLRFKNFPLITIVIFALSFMAIINSSEIFRGVFQGVKKGQLDAARSLGMSRGQMIRRVLLPQAFPTAIPMLSNLFIQIIKASALASMVSVVDVFSAAKITAQQNYRFLEAYIAVAIVYWGLSLVIEQATKGYEKIQHKKFRRTV